MGRANRAVAGLPLLEGYEIHLAGEAGGFISEQYLVSFHRVASVGRSSLWAMQRSSDSGLSWLPPARTPHAGSAGCVHVCSLDTTADEVCPVKGPCMPSADAHCMALGVLICAPGQWLLMAPSRRAVWPEGRLCAPRAGGGREAAQARPGGGRQHRQASRHQNDLPVRRGHLRLG